MTDDNGQKQVLAYDFSQLQNININLSVEIGQATYWSELMQVQTLANMLSQKLIDNIQYLELLPDGYIPGRDKIIQSIKQQQAMAGQQQMMAGQGNAPVEAQPMQELSQAMGAAAMM